MTSLIQRKEEKASPMNPATVVMLRVRRAVWLVLSMLSLSLLLVVLGAYAATRTESLNVSGYASGVILTLGSFLGLLGLLLDENRKQLLTAAIVFLSFGIVTSFLCLLIDGVRIALNMDMRPLKAGRCQFYSSGSSYIYENYYTNALCWSLKESCTVSVRSGTCFCCDLYDCANGDYLNNYYEFVGVESCDEVFTLYVLVWTLACLNLGAFFTGTLTTAVLGSIKNLRRSHMTDNRTSPSAPLLMDTNTHTAGQLHPGASVLFPPGERAADISSGAPFVESNPPPFNLLLSHRVHGVSA